MTPVGALRCRVGGAADQTRVNRTVHCSGPSVR